MDHEFDDTLLMAFADGELDDEKSAEIEAAINDDKQLAERVAGFMQTRALAQEAMAPLADQPVPDALRASVLAMVARNNAQTTANEPVASDNVISIADAPARHFPRAPMSQLAIAASIALVVGGVLGHYFSGENIGPASDGLTTATLGNPELVRAIQTVPSGSEMNMDNGARLRFIASFLSSDSRLCREFEIDPVGGDTSVVVACSEDSQWQVRFQVAAAPSDGGYAPASSLATLDAYLEAIGAGQPLSTQEELKLLTQ